MKIICRFKPQEIHPQVDLKYLDGHQWSSTFFGTLFISKIINWPFILFDRKLLTPELYVSLTCFLFFNFFSLYLIESLHSSTFKIRSKEYSILFTNK